MVVLYLIIVGAAAGFIATRLMDIETNVPVTIAIGILGAALGWLLLQVFLAVIGVAAAFVGAIIGAALLIWIYRQFFENDR
ncbi:MAG: GlsB/YeaQ/YmgE family stress response membrane protein [Paracoccaceae bacterium]